MPGDLSSSSPKPATAVRSWLILLAIVIGTSVSTVGTAKPSEQSRAPSTQPSTELLHDLAIDSTIERAVPASAVIPPQELSPAPASRVMVMEVTAYCACKKCCGPNAQGITASGKHVAYNNGKFVAADTSVLPFGTKIIIPGYDNQPVEVIDRGGAIKGNKLDVFYASHEEALQWGRQKVEVTIVD